MWCYGSTRMAEANKKVETWEQGITHSKKHADRSGSGAGDKAAWTGCRREMSEMSQ